MPAKFEEDLIWVAANAPVSDSSFLGSKIGGLCGGLPIFWLRPAYSGGKSPRKDEAAPNAVPARAEQRGSKGPANSRLHSETHPGSRTRAAVRD